MRNLCGIFLAALLLLLASPAAAASFTVLDWELGHQVSYQLDGVAGRAYTAQLEVELDGVLGTSFCVDLEQTIGKATYEGEVSAPDALTGLDYVAAAAIANGWANDLDRLASELGVSRRDAITGVQGAIWEALYGDRLVLDLGRLNSEHPGSARAFDHVAGLSYPWADDEVVVVFRGHQDQVMTPAVPEPGAFLSYGLGTLIVAHRLRRRRALAMPSSS